MFYMDIVIIFLVVVLIIVISVVIYYRLNYIFVNKNDKKVLNSGFSFLDDNYLNNYINSIQISN